MYIIFFVCKPTIKTFMRFPLTLIYILVYIPNNHYTWLKFTKTIVLSSLKLHLSIGIYQNQGGKWPILQANCRAGHHFLGLIVVLPCSLWLAVGTWWPCPLPLISQEGCLSCRHTLSLLIGGEGWGNSTSNPLKQSAALRPGHSNQEDQLASTVEPAFYF